MSEFSSENLPLPIVDGVNGVPTPKESATLQYYRNSSNNTGFQLTVNSTTQQLLPNNAYNLLDTKLGQITFIDGKKAFFAKEGTYTHTIYVSVYSSSPNSGLAAIDVINNFGNSLKSNFVVSKNITPNNVDIILLSAICDHTVGEIIQLRFGGGSFPAGGNLELNILSINWTIIET